MSVSVMNAKMKAEFWRIWPVLAPRTEYSIDEKIVGKNRLILGTVRRQTTRSGACFGNSRVVDAVTDDG
jgi:hypothetical protein